MWKNRKRPLRSTGSLIVKNQLDLTNECDVPREKAHVILLINCKKEFKNIENNISLSMFVGLFPLTCGSTSSH